jgi:hypothetical protein
LVFIKFFRHFTFYVDAIKFLIISIFFMLINIYKVKLPVSSIIEYLMQYFNLQVFHTSKDVSLQKTPTILFPLFLCIFFLILFIILHFSLNSIGKKATESLHFLLNPVCYQFPIVDDELFYTSKAYA